MPHSNIKFTKMHALGNDFMIIETLTQSFTPDSQLIRLWSNRHTGVGFDQLLLIEPAGNTQADFIYRIFNADGSEVAQCGNGARCIARFLYETNLYKENTIKLQTSAGILETKLESNGLVTVSLGIPCFIPQQIPFAATTQSLTYPITINEKTWEVVVLSLGNPHCIILVDDLNTFEVAKWGALVHHHPRFPQKTNVEFVQIINKQKINLRVYERGTGETLACGSGAGAAVIATYLLGHTTSKVMVMQPGGELEVFWPDQNQPITLTGPTTSVYSGVISLVHSCH